MSLIALRFIFLRVNSYVYHSTQYLEREALLLTIARIPVDGLGMLLIAGIQRRALLQIRGMNPKISQIFNLNGNWLKVIVYGMLSSAVLIPISYMDLGGFNLHIPIPYGLIFNSRTILLLLGSLSVSALTGATPLIMMDLDLSFVNALSLSLRTYSKCFLPLIGLISCASFLRLVGYCAIYVEAFPLLSGHWRLVSLIISFSELAMTYSLVPIVIALVYNDFFRPGPLVRRVRSS